MRIDKYDPNGSCQTTDEPIAQLVETLERCGARFTVDANGYLQTALDGLGRPPRYVDAIVIALMLLADQIKDYLALRATEGTIQ